ncbi:hypothetical protein NDU88_004816 [Pleurodeles waltl]|uniref:Uncharacterized protein n=1 Tax=Pleurodeles waltl TaxID=8319 RepID=A0AAV7M851_PLEWA|nr:hypothetical protein NDU88_004816 [Pleurodeles waltl]
MATMFLYSEEKGVVLAVKTLDPAFTRVAVSRGPLYAPEDRKEGSHMDGGGRKGDLARIGGERNRKGQPKDTKRNRREEPREEEESQDKSEDKTQSQRPVLPNSPGLPGGTEGEDSEADNFASQRTEL